MLRMTKIFASTAVGAFMALFLTGCAVTDTSSPGEILGHVYAGHYSACTIDSDADIADPNRLTLVAGEMYKIYCFDPAADDGVKCRCIAGNSAIDATAVEATFLPANSQEYWILASGLNFVSCQVFQDNVQVHACKKR